MAMFMDRRPTLASWPKRIYEWPELPEVFRPALESWRHTSKTRSWFRTVPSSARSPTLTALAASQRNPSSTSRANWPRYLSDRTTLASGATYSAPMNVSRSS